MVYLWASFDLEGYNQLYRSDPRMLQVQ